MNNLHNVSGQCPFDVVTARASWYNQHEIIETNSTKERHMAEHKHGEMNSETQKSSYDAFIKFGTWSIGVVIGILVFMAIFAR